VRRSGGGGIVHAMPMRFLVVAVVLFTLVTFAVVEGSAQAPARGRGTPTRVPAAPAAAAPAASPATLAQVMRGILFPNSNVIFAAQHDEFADIKPDADTSLSTDPIKGVYGGWEAVENSSLALVEATRLITVPGRKCSSGKMVPLQDANFMKFVGELRTASLGAYKAAQSKDQDQILDAAEKLGVACSHCHTMFREKTPEQGGEAARCTRG
jgi:hypothetical protein